MPIEPNYVLYLDETGDHTIGVTEDLGKRYLGIGGPFIHRTAHKQLDDDINRLKRNHLPCEISMPFLHRKEIMQARGAFSCLQRPTARAAFDEELMHLIRDTPFKMLAVVIDKTQHGRKLYRSLRHPYHYCLHALLERFCGYLDRMNSVGHVVAEARGKEEDLLLKQAYREVYESGTKYLSPKVTKKTLVSPELEIRNKKENVSGLQLADILVHPATRDVLKAYKRLDDLGSAFNEQMADLLKLKYNRHMWNGRANGYGRILLS